MHVGEAPAREGGTDPISLRAAASILIIMTRISLQKHGKVEEHGKAVGVSSPQDLERRARELARIDGRDEPSADDRERARLELLNENLPPTVSQDADASMQSLSRDPSDPATDRGRQAPEYMDVDEEEAVERLALEGVEEAQHEQMVQARNTDALDEEDADVGTPRDGTPREEPARPPKRTRRK